MSAEKEQQEINDYQRVEAFLADPAVKAAIKKLDEQFYAQFKGAETIEKRDQAWAKSRALDALSGELLATMSNGQQVLRQRELREAQERARANQRTRQK